MSKMATSFRKKIFFRSNINKIRKAVIHYLINEGIEAQIKDGIVQITLREHQYEVEFDLENEYPRCDITFEFESEKYENLKLSQKTFIADKINTQENRHSIAKAFKDSIIVDTHFYFTNKKMLLSLFYEYLIDLDDTVNDMDKLTIKKIKEQENRTPIGFRVNITSPKDEDSKAVACKEDTVK